MKKDLYWLYRKGPICSKGIVVKFSYHFSQVVKDERILPSGNKERLFQGEAIKEAKVLLNDAFTQEMGVFMICLVQQEQGPPDGATARYEVGEASCGRVPRGL